MPKVKKVELEPELTEVKTPDPDAPVQLKNNPPSFPIMVLPLTNGKEAIHLTREYHLSNYHDTYIMAGRMYLFDGTQHSGSRPEHWLKPFHTEDLQAEKKFLLENGWTDGGLEKSGKKNR